MGAGESKAKEDGGPTISWSGMDEHAPDALVAWTEVTLPDGTVAEVGGIDPFIEIAPPYELLAPALKVAHRHRAGTGLEARPDRDRRSSKRPALGADVYRVEAVAGNRGSLSTHTKMAQRARSHLPVRLGDHASGGR